jgi:hypothetical protein
MNSMARAALDARTGSHSLPEKLQTGAEFDVGNVAAVKDILAVSRNVSGVGVDQGAPVFPSTFNQY